MISQIPSLELYFDTMGILPQTCEALGDKQERLLRSLQGSACVTELKKSVKAENTRQRLELRTGQAHEKLRWKVMTSDKADNMPDKIPLSGDLVPCPPRDGARYVEQPLQC